MRMTMNEIKEKYPNKWIFLVDMERDSEGEVISGVPKGIYSDDELDSAEIDYEHDFGYLFKTTIPETVLGCIIVQ